MGRLARGRLVATPIGIQLGATTPPADLGDIAAEAEGLGYGEIWLAEDYFQLGGISSVATVLGTTRSVPVGLGVAAAVARHPAVMAMELATLGSAFPGRFMAGIGHGVPAWVRQMGLQPASLLRSLREAATAIRRLLDGDEVTEDGEYFSFDRVRLLHPPTARLPLYFGVHGPGRWSSRASWSMAPCSAGSAHPTTLPGHESASTRVDDEPAGVTIMLSSPYAWQGARCAGGGPRCRGSRPRIPPELLDEFVAAGDASAGARMIRRLLDAGADRVVLVPNPAGLRITDAMVDQIRAAAALLHF